MVPQMMKTPEIVRYVKTTEVIYDDIITEVTGTHVLLTKRIRWSGTPGATEKHMGIRNRQVLPLPIPKRGPNPDFFRRIKRFA